MLHVHTLDPDESVSHAATHTYTHAHTHTNTHTHTLQDLSLTEFLHALNVIQVKMLMRNKANTKNYKPPVPGGGSKAKKGLR